jgi:hypothetical protein
VDHTYSKANRCTNALDKLSALQNPDFVLYVNPTVWKANRCTNALAKLSALQNPDFVLYVNPTYCGGCSVNL